MSLRVDPLTAIEVVERIKRHLIESDPNLEHRLKMLAGEGFENQTQEYFKAKLLAVAGGLDEESAAGKRRLRKLLKAFDLDSAELETFLVRESAEEFYLTIPPGRRKKIQAALERLKTFESTATSHKSFPRILKSFRTQHEAVSFVSSAFPQLSGLQVYQFLQAVRYPIMVPDPARRRLLLRLGLISKKDMTKDAMREWFEAGYELSHATGENSLVLNLLFGLFSGLGRELSKAKPVCLERPRCPSCPVTAYCDYYRLVRPQTAKSASRKMKMLAPADRPREKLLNLGSEALTESELLSIILRTGREESSALDLAGEILNRFSDLDGVDQASIHDLCKVSGIGPAKAAEIKAAFELSRRLSRKSFDLGTKFTNASQVFEAFRLRFLNAKQEQFVVLALNTKNRLVKDFVVTKGTLRTTAVDPQVVYKHAIQVSASAVIFLHNHPSGEPEPSPEDRKITAQLVEAGKTLGIRILDHIIIGSSSYFSFAEEGLL